MDKLQIKLASLAQAIVYYVVPLMAHQPVLVVKHLIFWKEHNVLLFVLQSNVRRV